jgi:hypothetical protein
MRLFRSARWLKLALLVSLIPASSYAGVLVSVGVAPPPLPVYAQPPCPEPGMMWTPGYWAYGDDGYYWVPGTWVPAPYVGALWTPGYWGWSGGLFVFHRGYWGPHVGYYGGVNYGFGYGGIGFAGGLWRGGVFSYNTAVMHVGFRGHGYVDRRAVERGFVARNSHVAFSGGPGGIHHDPSPGERLAERDHHTTATRFQTQHAAAARADKSSYASKNGGHPSNGAVSRPLGNGAHGASASHGAAASHGAPASHTAAASHPPAQTHGGGGSNQHSAPASHSAPQSHSVPASHSAPPSHAAPQSHAAPASHVAPASHTAPQSHSAPASHTASEGGGKHK